MSRKRSKDGFYIGGTLVDFELAMNIPFSWLERNYCLPLISSNETLRLAVSAISDNFPLADFEVISGTRVELVIAPTSQIRRAFKRLGGLSFFCGSHGCCIGSLSGTRMKPSTRGPRPRR